MTARETKREGMRRQKMRPDGDQYQWVPSEVTELQLKQLAHTVATPDTETARTADILSTQTATWYLSSYWGPVNGQARI